jgi:hypothetical protein
MQKSKSSPQAPHQLGPRSTWGPSIAHIGANARKTNPKRGIWQLSSAGSFVTATLALMALVTAGVGTAGRDQQIPMCGGEPLAVTVTTTTNDHSVAWGSGQSPGRAFDPDEFLRDAHRPDHVNGPVYLLSVQGEGPRYA